MTHAIFLSAMLFAASSSTSGSTGVSGSGSTTASSDSGSTSGSSGSSSSTGSTGLTGSTGSSTGGCTELTVGTFKAGEYGTDADGGAFATFTATFTPDVGTVGTPDNLVLDNKSDATGSETFTGDVNGDRLLFVGEDLDSSGQPTKALLATSGSINVTSSTVASGTINATLSDVTLVEIDQTGAPVSGGECVHITSATVTATAPTPPSSWTCQAGYYGVGDGCDCGCGAVDADCADASATCDYCDCSTGYTCDSTDHTQCDQVVVPSSWTCDPSYYQAGDGCDCGCGAVDPDCADATAASCQYCDACTTDPNADCTTVVNSTNNAQCLSTTGGSGGSTGNTTAGTSTGNTTAGTTTGNTTGNTTAGTTTGSTTAGTTGNTTTGGSTSAGTGGSTGGNSKSGGCVSGLGDASAAFLVLGLIAAIRVRKERFAK